MSWQHTRRFQNSVGAGNNYNNQFLYISAIAFNKIHIYIMEDVLGIQGYIFQQVWWGMWKVET
jgi:hypothetical protein